MPRTSAGLLLFRGPEDHPEVLLVHPGGPFWATKDQAAWSIPKGELDEGEEGLAAAMREAEEELGARIDGEVVPLDPVRQAGGKLVLAWALRGDFDPATLKSNTFSMEWPPKSGRRQEFPEIDQAEWFDLETARWKIHKGLVPLIDQFARMAAEGDARLGIGARRSGR